MAKLKNCVERKNGHTAQKIAFEGELITIDAFAKKIGKATNTVRRFLRKHNPGYDPDKWEFDCGEDIRDALIAQTGKGIVGKECSDDAHIELDLYRGKTQYCVPYKGKYRSPWELAPMLHVVPDSIYRAIEANINGDDPSKWGVKNGKDVYDYIIHDFRTDPRVHKNRIKALERQYRIRTSKVQIKEIKVLKTIKLIKEDGRVVSFKYVRTINNHYEPVFRIYVYQQIAKNGKPGYIETFNYGQLLGIVGDKE